MLYSHNAYVYKQASTMGHLPLIHACTCSQREHTIQDLVFAYAHACTTMLLQSN